MNASSASAGLPFNPDMLIWAREWRGRSIEEAAEKIGVPEDKIAAWETGQSTPTVRQARNLASFYERPFLEFFLANKPSIPELQFIPDFRLHKGSFNPRADREIQAIQAWAEETRHNALDLFAILGEDMPKLPAEFQASLDTNPEKAANLARELSDLQVEDQIHLKSAERGKVNKSIRRAIERIGILVLKDSSLGKYGVRGLTISLSPLPIIIFGSESPAAQSFTLAHELGHVILQQSSISDSGAVKNAKTNEQRAEKWCDEFAAAFLVPASELIKIWAKPNQPNASIDDSQLRNLANEFSISPHAMLVRLVNLGYVDADYYWSVKRPQFLIQEAAYKGGGKSLYYGSRFRNSFGDLYTGLVLDAWGSGRITNHNAAEFMDIKNIDHLFDIREHFEA